MWIRAVGRDDRELRGSLLVFERQHDGGAVWRPESVAQGVLVVVGDDLVDEQLGQPARAFGAVIGKALRTLEEGQGLIPVLVALQ